MVGAGRIRPSIAAGSGGPGELRVFVAFAVLAVGVGAAYGCRETRRAGSDARPGVLTVWAHHGQPDEQAAMAEIVAAFNEAHAGSGPHIVIEFYPDRQYADKVSIASATGRLPDVLEVDGPYVGPWAAEGLLQPLDAYVDDELRRDLLPTIIEQGTYEEQLFALGAFDSALVVYYNREIIERAKLSPPQRVEDAWDWETFVAALHAVRPHVALPLSLHLDEPGDEWMTYAFAPLIWSNGGELIDVENGQVDGVLNAPASVAAIARWQELFSAGLAEPSSTNPNPFADGQAAFDWTGHWLLPSFEQRDDLRFGAMPLPRMGERSVTSAGSWCWGMSRHAHDRDAAWRFIAWVLDADRGVRRLVEANAAVPARRSALRHFPDFERDVRRLFRDQLESSARARPRTAVYLTLTSEFARALRDVAVGADVQQALDQAARSVQRDLDRQKAWKGAD